MRRAAQHYDNLCQIDGRIVLAGEHASYIPAWQEGAILSALDAITRLHKRILASRYGDLMRRCSALAAILLLAAALRAALSLRRAQRSRRRPILEPRPGLRGAGRRGAFRQRLRRLPSAGRERRERRRRLSGAYAKQEPRLGGLSGEIAAQRTRGMPPVGQMMSDQQIADVINYVRTHFGNAYDDAVSAADVEAARRQTGSGP